MAFLLSPIVVSSQSLCSGTRVQICHCGEPKPRAKHAGARQCVVYGNLYIINNHGIASVISRPRKGITAQYCDGLYS